MVLQPHRCSHSSADLVSTSQTAGRRPDAGIDSPPVIRRRCSTHAYEQTEEDELTRYMQQYTLNHGPSKYSKMQLAPSMIMQKLTTRLYYFDDCSIEGFVHQLFVKH